MTTNPTMIAKPTPAFFAQAVVSFGVSVVAVGMGIAYLPVNAWQRAFLAIGLLFVVTSAFTLAKCVRDHQDATHVTSRVDQARLDKMLSEHDPYKV
ncbi:MAG TPA: YiaA/YiaB family inner membrane protein [Pseudonocardiaceae bacterium]